MIHVVLFYQDAIIYSLISDGEPSQFFFVNSDTGLITTKKFLTSTQTKEFRVSHQFVSLCMWKKHRVALATVKSISYIVLQMLI